MKVVLLHWCSDKKIIFMKIQWNLDSKTFSELGKFPFLKALTQDVLQDIKKSFEYAHSDIKIYWILPDTMKLQNCHHASGWIIHLDSFFSPQLQDSILLESNAENETISACIPFHVCWCLSHIEKCK